MGALTPPYAEASVPRRLNTWGLLKIIPGVFSTFSVVRKRVCLLAPKESSIPFMAPQVCCLGPTTSRST